VSAFQAATAIDPTFAPAYAGLAHAKAASAVNRNVLVEAYGEARAAALHALALDDKCPDAYAALGVVMLLAEWDWIAAERSFQRALALDPSHAHAYLRYGDLMEALGDLERGFHLKLKGLECDSTSVLAHLAIAVSCWNQRRYDDMIVFANKALDRDPQHHVALELLMGAYWKLGDLDRVDELRRAAANLVSRVPEGADYGAEFQLALQSAIAGDLDAAFEHLQRLIDKREPALIHLAVAPQWDNLRADPRFNECLLRMKLRPVL
jgi:tetratricopeptide (TPR) repeat protein